MKILNNIDLARNELQNALMHKLASAPSNPVKGQTYFNTTENKAYVYDGTNWIDITSQGKQYTFQNGVEEVSSGIVEAQLNSTQGNVTLTKNGGLKAEVAEASTSAKGIIEIATDQEASTGTSETLAVNPKQLATKVTANTAITGATKTKITYDSKGLVTSGDDLSASDIPDLTLSKITDVTATASELNVLDGITASTAELNILDGVTASTAEINVLDGITATTTELNYVDGVTSNIQTQLDSKLDEKPDGTNDLLDGNNKINTTYIPDVVLGQLLYGGTVTGAGVATLSTNAKTKLGTSDNSITLTNDTTAITGYVANEGIYYIVSSDGSFASLGILTGDWLISTGSAWQKVDNTDAVTGVKGDAETDYRIGNINITKANIGLGNVDNTSDLDKPVSTATQTAISNVQTQVTYLQTTKLNKSTVAEYTLLASGWSNNAQTLSITGKTSANDARVMPSNIGTDSAVYNNTEAIANAGIYKVVDNGTSLTFTCNTTPLVDLKILVEVFNDIDDSTGSVSLTPFEVGDTFTSGQTEIALPIGENIDNVLAGLTYSSGGQLPACTLLSCYRETESSTNVNQVVFAMASDGKYVLVVASDDGLGGVVYASQAIPDFGINTAGWQVNSNVTVNVSGTVRQQDLNTTDTGWNGVIVGKGGNE